MQAVILTAIADACGHSTDYGRKREAAGIQRRAKLWFDDAGSDFRGVCELAGLHPDTVRKFALAFIASGKPFPRRARESRGDRNPLSVAAIAGRAGVSASAVRSVLRSDKGSPEMKERVRNALRELTEQASCAA
jgi:hypothetical protein